MAQAIHESWAMIETTMSSVVRKVGEIDWPQHGIAFVAGLAMVAWLGRLGWLVAVMASRLW
jgi:hypothetical protein